MSLQKTLRRNIDLRETNLARVFASKQKLNTVSPVMALHGNNPSRFKAVKRASHKREQLVKLARVVVACLITAAGGGDVARPVPVDNSPGVRLDQYHRNIHARGTSITAPREGYVAPARKPGKPHTGRKTLHQRIVSSAKARQQENRT